MVKLASNAFLATKISFINEIANVCEETGADVTEVARGMGLDDRIGPKFLQAGLGFGGSCFPKDVSALKQLAGNSGYHFQLLNAVIEVNELQKRRTVGKLQKHLGDLPGKKIALLGLAFKPNTDDMREATSLVLSARLQAAGAEVSVYDPIAEDEAQELIGGVRFASDALDCVRDADAVVLVTEWDEFKALDFAQVAEAMAGTLVVDGRNAFDPSPSARRASSTRASGAADAGRHPRGRGGHPAAAADLEPAQAGGAARRPAVHRLHARVLVRHGVDDVIMSCGFKADSVRAALGDGSGYGVALRFLEEPEPRGTAGALKYAEEHLADRFLMLNGDVLSDMDLSAQVAQHEATGATGTLALVPVADPSAYGLVRINEDNSVKGFLEKPSADQIDTNLISAGAYVLERSVLDMIEPDRNVSIEREIWPQLVGNGLYAYPHQHAYWLDIGTPATYLKASSDILEGFVETAPVQRIGDGCEIAPDAHVGSTAVLGEGVTVGADARIERSVVLAGCTIGAQCELEDCIVAAGARIGDRTMISGGAVIGEGVVVGADNVLSHGIKVFGGTEIGDGAVKF